MNADLGRATHACGTDACARPPVRMRTREVAEVGAVVVRARASARERERACTCCSRARCVRATTHTRALPIIYGRGTPHTGAVRQWGCALHEGGGTELMAPT